MNGYDEAPWEREWWLNRSTLCTCGASRTPYAWCDDDCDFVRPAPCAKCGHSLENHDVDDGCGACALAFDQANSRHDYQRPAPT